MSRFIPGRALRESQRQRRGRLAPQTLGGYGLAVIKQRTSPRKENEEKVDVAMCLSHRGKGKKKMSLDLNLTGVG